jgi:HAD superfamily hydrolase (TIGR01490 family)
LAQHLTIFDLDHTLIPIDSDYQWSQYLIHLGLVDKEAHQAQNDVFYQHYVDGCLDIHAYLAFQLEPLAKVPMAQIEAWRTQYIQERIAEQIKPAALELVKHHQARGDFCMIITGTNDFVTRPIADAFGIEHLLGTQLEVVNGFFTGKLIGTPSFREGKIVRLNQFLKLHNLSISDFASSTFYSDSANDIPLLEKVSHPVATNPDKTLTALAQARGWKTLHLFDQLIENVAHS